MVLVYSDSADFYNEIEAAIPIQSKLITNQVLLQNEIEKASLIIVDGDKKQDGAVGFMKDTANMPPVIVIVSKKEDEYLSTWAGASIVIKKPINIFELQSTIENISKS